MECRPTISGGRANRHAIPSVLYPPMPVSQASEYIVTVGLVNVMLLISITLSLTASRKVSHNCKSTLCVFVWDLGTMLLRSRQEISKAN